MVARDLLHTNGLTPRGKTPLGDRVYRQLYRMLRSGIVQRDGTGFVLSATPSANNQHLDNGATARAASSSEYVDAPPA